MKEALLKGDADFDPTLFSPEELALMRDANGATNDFAVKDVNALQTQFMDVARLVAEGGERERMLRGLINELTLLTKKGLLHQNSIYEQTQALAQIIISSSEREVDLQRHLESLRSVVIGRVKKMT